MVATPHASIQRRDQRIDIAGGHALPAQAGDHLAGVPGQFRPLQEDHDIGAVQRRRQRIGMRAAEELILSGRILPAKKLHEMGVVDILVKDGEGQTAVRTWILDNARRRNGLQAAFRARKHVHPVTREELDAITNVWVDAAFRLQDRDLKMMGRIVRAQMRRTEFGNVTDVTEEALAEEPAASAETSEGGAVATGEAGGEGTGDGGQPDGQR